MVSRLIARETVDLIRLAISLTFGVLIGTLAVQLWHLPLEAAAWIGVFLSSAIYLSTRFRADAAKHLISEEGASHFSALHAPKVRPAEDRFGVAGLAAHLANTIAGVPAPFGFTIAISGKWGTGKTSFLNFLQADLAERVGLQVLVLNSWWFAGRDDLAKRLLGDFRAALQHSAPRAVRGLADRLTEVLQEAPAGGGWFKVFRLAAFREKPVYILKQELAEALRRSGARVVVVFDDLDRLVGSELREVFALLAAVGDLPNVIFVLGMDVDHAASQLESDGAIKDGHEFLEKLIQIRFDLPDPPEEVLLGAFQRLAHDLPTTVSGSIPDPRRLDELLHHVRYLLKTPRDLSRVSAALAFNFPLLASEVNAADLVVIETLRQLAPQFYQRIRENSALLIGTSDDFGLERVEPRNLRLEYQTIASGVVTAEGFAPSDRIEQGVDLLMALFPKSAAALRNVHGGHGELGEWRRTRRICHPDVWDTYSRFQPRTDKLSHAELLRLLDVARSGREAVSDWLEQLSDRRKTFDAFEAIRDAGSEIPDDLLEAIVTGLLDFGDRALANLGNSEGILAFGADVGIVRALFGALREKEARTEVMRRALQKTKSIAMPTLAVRVFGQQHGLFGSKEKVPSRDVLFPAGAVLDFAAMQSVRLSTAATDGELLAVPHLPSVLHAWVRFDSSERPRLAVRKAADSDERFGRLLVAFVGQVIGVRAEVVRTVPPRWLEPFFSLDELHERSRQLLVQPNLPVEVQEAARLLQEGLAAPAATGEEA